MSQIMITGMKGRTWLWIGVAAVAAAATAARRNRAKSPTGLVRTPLGHRH